MIISFLYPFDLRGFDAPYLWIYLEQIRQFNKEKECIFLCSSSYLKSKEYFLNNNRWEIGQGCYFKGFEESVSKFEHVILDEQKLNEIYCSQPDDLTFFKNYLINIIPEFEVLLLDALSGILEKGKIDAVLTWSNCATLKAVCNQLGIKLIYNELGPFRPPVFRKTGFLDFSGVNGFTEAAARFEKFKREIEEKTIQLNDYNELIDLLKGDDQDSLIIDKELEGEFDLGLIFQVENDSNVIAYSNGFNNVKLIEYAKEKYKDKKIVGRNHPAGEKDYSNLVKIDYSSNSIEFIKKSKKLITVNSGAALEAALLRKEVEILGDSPYAILNNINPTLSVDDHLLALNFLSLNYLVPFSEVFQREYVEFRLSNPTESEINLKHINVYQSQLLKDYKEKLAQELTRVNELKNEKNRIEQSLMETLNSYSYRFTYPMRKMKAVMLMIIGKS